MSCTRKGTVLLLVSDTEIFRDFEEWVASSASRQGDSLLHVSIGEAASLDSGGLPEGLKMLTVSGVTDCSNEIELTKMTCDALSRTSRYDRVFFDPLSSFSKLLEEDSAPAHMLEELASLLDIRRSFGYFCLQLGSHEDKTIAKCKDLVDVCIQVTRQEDSLLIQALQARGIYTKGFFSPHNYRSWPAIGKSEHSPSGFCPNIRTAVGL